MFDSFFESAKATIRRAGALDGLSIMKDDNVKAGVASVPADPDRDSAIKGERYPPSTESEVGARSRKVDSSSTATAAAAASTAASSLSRSFSRLKASGATSVSKAMLPLKKALGGDPEAAGARASLVKYKADLSVALAEATAMATKRRDERDLLTRALAGQDNDLQSWGYLSVLPAFREHRRHETNRAQLRTSIVEQEAQLLSSKRQEVNKVLRSIPVIGPWTPPGLPRSAWGGTPQGMAGTHGGEDDVTGFHFDEKAFVIAPDVLLAMDEGLASKRQLLVLFDRECAAAAEALAEKVSEAGGLEPRSPQDRAEVLLSLLTRYHVLGEAINGTGAAVAAHEAKPKEAPKISMAPAVKEAAPEADEGSPLEGGFDERITNTESDHTVVNDDHTADGDPYGETPAGDASTGDCAGKSEIVADGSTAEANPPPQCSGSSFDGKDPIEVDCSKLAHGSGNSVDKGSDVEDEPEGVDAPQADALPLRGEGTSVDGGVGDETAANSLGDDESPPSLVAHKAETKNLPPVIPVQWPAPKLPSTWLGPEAKRSAGNEAGGMANVSGDKAFGRGADDGLLDVGAFRERRKKCEEAFMELMSDERTREGRLLQRFLIMVHAKKSPNTSTQAPASACPDMPSGPALPFTVEDSIGGASLSKRAEGGGRCCTIDKRLTTVMKRSKSLPEAGDSWEQEAAVGPQVVKAFINYFAKDYLGKRFDVPDLLIPSLTKLVESLVFRRARRVAFGYNRLRVTRDDLIWREKAEKVRELPLLELGISPEYIPTSFGTAPSNAEPSFEQPVTCGTPKNRDHGTMGVVAGAMTSNSAVSGRECVISAGRARVNNDDTERRMGGVSHEAPPPGAEAEVTGDQGELTSGNEDFVFVTVATPNNGIDASGMATDEALTVTSTADLSAGRDVAEEEDNVDLAVEGDTGSPYERVSQEFGRLVSCTTPAEMLEVVEEAMALLAKEAARISGSDVHLDADTLLPLLVYVLVQADLPRVHEVLNFLRNFRGPSWRGERAYYVTCIEAAISFVVEWGSDGLKGKPDRLASPVDTSRSSGGFAAGGPSDGSSRACQGAGGVANVVLPGPGEDEGRGREANPREYDEQGVKLAEEEQEQAEGLKDLMCLGIFLDNHEVQEDTVDVLSSAGYL